jgi:hypothetical protein
MPVIAERRTATDGRMGAGTVVTIVIAFAVLMVVAGSGVLSPPEHIERLTIENPHSWPANVDVRRAGAAGWTGVGVVSPKATHVYREVLDAGETWELRFGYAGEVLVTMTVGLEQLLANDWTVTVPASFAAAAEAAGLSPLGAAAGRQPGP